MTNDKKQKANAYRQKKTYYCALNTELEVVKSDRKKRVFSPLAF